MSIYSLILYGDPLANYNIAKMKRKIAFNDLKIKSIQIEATVKKPGKHEDYWERFRIDGRGFDFKRHYYNVLVMDEEYEVAMQTSVWFDIWHAIAAEFEVLEFPESDIPKDWEKTHYEIELFSVMHPEINKTVRLSGHPRITATKKMIEALRRIAKVVPEGWPMPYPLDNLG